MNTFDKFRSVVGSIKYQATTHKSDLFIFSGCMLIAGAICSMWNVKDKVEEVLDEHDENIEDLHAQIEDEIITEKEYKKEVSKRYVKTGLKMARAVGPTVGLTISGFTFIFLGRHSYKKEKLGAIAAYNSIDALFKAYRSRVIEEEGEDADRHYRYGTKREEVSETVTDKDGKKKKVKKTKEVFVSTDEFSRIFDRGHLEFHRDEIEGCYAKGANFMWLEGIQSMMSRRLQLHHQVTLNDVYDALRMPKSYEGSFVGWRDTKHGGKSDYISFGLEDHDRAIIDLPGGDYGIPLQFDVDGVILDSKFNDISGTNAFKP